MGKQAEPQRGWGGGGGGVGGVAVVGGKPAVATWILMRGAKKRKKEAEAIKV